MSADYNLNMVKKNMILWSILPTYKGPYLNGEIYNCILQNIEKYFSIDKIKCLK